jgi:exodeoxyribonuclease V beta subunit
VTPLDVETLPLVGNVVIEASAGTGKTYTITSLFLRLLLESELEVDQILVVTYTRAATAELRERIRARLASALACARGEPCEDPFIRNLCKAADGSGALQNRLEKALSNVDQAAILTIHAFCQRVLREHAFESGSGFGFALTAHAAPIIDEIATDYFTNQLFATDRLRAELLYKEMDVLRTLSARAGGGHTLRVLPETSATASEPSRAALEAARADCRALWQRERELVVREVLELKGTSSKNVTRWAEQMDHLLASDAYGFSAGKEDPSPLPKHPFNAGFRYFTRTFAASKTKRPGLHPFFAQADTLLLADARLLESLNRTRAEFRSEFVSTLGRELDKRARETDVHTFDALLHEVERALFGERAEGLASALQKRYRAALVDEFQDTDPAQYRMFARVFGQADRPLFLIGDPKQAIYAFRGADVHAYLAARKEAGERVYTLTVNRRSDRDLVTALNTLYARVQRPFLLEDIAYLPVSTPSDQPTRFFARDARAPLDLALIEGPKTEDALRREIARRVALDIAALLESGARRIDEERGHGRIRPVTAADIAVLCRTNHEAYEVQLALSGLGIPAVLTGDASVFDSEDAGHIERALSALAHPADAGALRSFLCSAYGGLDAEGLLRLEQDDATWDFHARNFRAFAELFVSRGFTQALRRLCAVYGVEERLLARPDGLRRLTNLNHLSEILAEVSLSERLGPLALLRWLKTAQQDAAVRSDWTFESHELRLESSDTAVHLTTVHKSKGLEYPIVYCPFLYKPALLRNDEKAIVRYHDPDDGALCLDVGSEHLREHTKIAEREALAEALRLLYVALTRAKHRVTVVLPVPKTNAQSALIYTLVGGDDLAGARQRLEELEARGGMLTFLEARAQESGGLSVRMLEDSPTARTRVPDAPESLSVRSVRRALDNSVRTASFSALVSAKSSPFEPSADYDALAPDEPREEPKHAAPLALTGFPRGAGPGKLIHEVLEHCSFAADRSELSPLIAQILRARGYDPEHEQALTVGLHAALHTPLDEAGLTLAQVPTAARVNELEFLFPVHATLTPKSLSRLLRSEKAPSADPGYSRRVEALSFDALRGFLRGFIDLVFEHEGRFYLVDYKSNDLGEQARDYQRANLVHAMGEHHYFLQYLLYALSLHRHLKQRLAGYRYEQHFGGVFYLFLRGMAPSHLPGTGVFFDRPELALIEALDALMQGQPARDTLEAS